MTSISAVEFNKRHGVGTTVDLLTYPHLGDETPTRVRTVTSTPAWTLGHGEPVVTVEGRSGGHSLSRIEVVDPPLTRTLREVLARLDQVLGTYESASIPLEPFRVRGGIESTPRTLSAALSRLTAMGLVETLRRHRPGGPTVRRYRLTIDGVEALVRVNEAEVLTVSFAPEPTRTR